MTALAQRLRLIVQFKVLVALLLARKRIYETLARKTKLMVNIGGGIFLRPHWKVMDYRSPFYPFSRAYIDYDIDLFTKPRFPFADGTVRFFYSSHTLEHIPQEFCPNILAEIHRSLEPGGAVRLTMPDYDKLRRASETDNREYFSRQLAAGLTIEQAVVEQIATDQVDKASPAEVRRNFVSMTPAEFAETYCGRASREVQREMGGYHINWFNEEKLTGMLRAAGFENIYITGPQGSRFKELTGRGGALALGNLLDTERRLGIDTSHPEKSLFIEAVK